MLRSVRGWTTVAGGLVFTWSGGAGSPQLCGGCSAFISEMSAEFPDHNGEVPSLHSCRLLSVLTVYS
ncbi:hypothetical protein PFLUV_G00270760 [Perca fluviatilis]|uniref:Secreted protein n=1 Tax=Perca fluviatilis TaxID=8168 RepID=A0A6A5DWB7_PERFL|nr:hypothetical protein PFLUV_G00270760 [Perca fluviatilis]